MRPPKRASVSHRHRSATCCPPVRCLDTQRQASYTCCHLPDRGATPGAAGIHVPGYPGVLSYSASVASLHHQETLP